MTRLLHTGDLHLGLAGTNSWRDPTTGIESAIASAGRCWRQACEIAVDRGVDAMIIAGDVFHSRDPDAVSLNLFEAGLRILQGSGIPAVLIPGNHEGPKYPSHPCVLEIFHEPPLVQVSMRPEILDVDGIRMATLPWVSRELLLANRPGLSREAADQARIDALVSIIGKHRAEGADVLVGHWSVQGAILSNEKDLSVISEPVIPLAELEGPWRYVAMAHIHRAQSIEETAMGRSWQQTFSEGVVGAYSGSIDRVTFGEEREAKVALELDLDGYVDVIATTHEMSARRFTTLEWNVDIDGRGYDPNVAASGEFIEGAVVRIRGTLTEERAAAIDRQALQRSVLDAGAALVKVELDVERDVRRRDEQMTEGLAEEDALERWFDVKRVQEEERPPLRDLAKQLGEGAA